MSSNDLDQNLQIHSITAFEPYFKKGQDATLNVASHSKLAILEPNAQIIPRHKDELGVELSERLHELIDHGDNLANPIGSKDAHYNSRSHATFALACQLYKMDVPLELIAGLLINPIYKISAHVLGRPSSPSYAWRQVVRAMLAVDANFPDVNKDGKPLRTLRNTIFALIKLGLDCRYDQFRNRLTISGHVVQLYNGEITDKACAIIRDRIINDFDFDPFRQNVLDAVTIIALKNPFHPVQDYLDTLQWDGIKRLDTLFSDYFRAEDTELHRFAGQMMLVAGVRRIRNPGVKYDIMVVIEGNQGSGKSTALRILASDEFFSDQSILSRDDKTQMEGVEGIWIFEIAEMDGMNRIETSRMKSFITRQVDRARRAYAHFREAWPRQVIFVGTTNESFYLKDTTGNRRFLPIKTGEIDLARLHRDRDQLWAEASQLEQQGFLIHLPEELIKAATEAQTGRMQTDPWLDVLSAVKGIAVSGEERVFTETLYGESYLHIPAGQRQSFHPKRIAENMRQLGWDGPSRIRIGDRSLQGYRRPTELPDETLF